jgi:excisionase family DNA binding protein
MMADYGDITCWRFHMEEVRLRADEELLIRPAKAARMVGVSVSKFYAMIATGQVPFVRLGARAIRIPRKALEEWIESQTIRTRDEAA